MTTTIESSAPYQSGLDESVASQWQPQLRNDLNELQMYRAERAERDRQLDDGRRQTSKHLRALVLAAVTDIRAKLEEDVYTNRRHTLEQHLTKKWWYYELEHEQLPDGTVKVKLPNRKLIREVLTSQGL